MSECDFMRENMPLLLTESLDPARRELTHQHIERCAACSDEWAGYRETWQFLGALPEVEVPAHVKTQFLPNVEPPLRRLAPADSRRHVTRLLPHAAAVVLVASGPFHAGNRSKAVQHQE